jgi:hypothetical protein
MIVPDSAIILALRNRTAKGQVHCIKTARGVVTRSPPAPCAGARAAARPLLRDKSDVDGAQRRGRDIRGRSVEVEEAHRHRHAEQARTPRTLEAVGHARSAA